MIPRLSSPTAYYIPHACLCAPPPPPTYHRAYLNSILPTLLLLNYDGRQTDRLVA